MTEAATNILRHGGGGEIVLDARSYDHGGEVNVLALDGGRGMANVQDCLRDGVSTADSAGTGLGAIRASPTISTSIPSRAWAPPSYAVSAPRDISSVPPIPAWNWASCVCRASGKP